MASWVGMNSQEWQDPRLLFERYRAHLESLQGQIPEEFAQLNEEISLHDCHVSAYELNVLGEQLNLTLDGHDEAGGLRRYKVEYGGIITLRSLNGSMSLPGPCGYGDLGYDETDIDASGNLVHRLLFSTGIELEIVFAHFAISWT